jgi:hypothetical protein
LNEVFFLACAVHALVDLALPCDSTAALFFCADHGSSAASCLQLLAARREERADRGQVSLTSCSTPLAHQDKELAVRADQANWLSESRVVLHDDARWLLTARIAENHSFSLLLDSGVHASGVVELHALLDSSEACLHACQAMGTSALLCEVLWTGMETKRRFLRVRAIYAAAVNALVLARESRGRRFFFVHIGAHVGNTRCA